MLLSRGRYTHQAAILLPEVEEEAPLESGIACLRFDVGIE